MTMMLIAAEQETSRGWGGPIALAVAGVLFLLIIGGHWWWTEGRFDHSPTEDDESGVTVNRKVNAGSDTDDTDPDTDGDTDWAGRIVETPDGRRVRVHATSDGRRVHAEPVDDDLDLALDGPARETPEDAVARMEDAGEKYMDTVRHLMRAYGVSESTAKRTIDKVRRSRGKQSRAA